MLLEHVLKSWYLSSEKYPFFNLFILKVNKENFSFSVFVPKTERKGECNMYAHMFWDNSRGVNQTLRYLDYRASVFQTDRNKILDHIAEKFFFEPALCDRQVTQGYVIFLKYIEILVKPGMCDGNLIEWTLLQLQGGKKTFHKQTTLRDCSTNIWR